MFAQTIVHQVRKSATINDISRETSVSTTTVSRVLNGYSRKYRISEETEQHVIEVARKFDYRPNHMAVSLRKKTSNLIGLVVPDLSNSFFTNIASIVTNELKKNGYSVIITDCGDDENTEVEVVQLLNDRRIDGLLVMPSGEHRNHLEDLFRQGIPVICIDRYFESSPLPYVATNNYSGAYEITKYLLNCNHTKIACIQGLPHVMPNSQRVKGYVDAMKDAGLEPFSITGNDFSQENGYLETKLLLQKEQRPTAIFGLSNTIILGALKALQEENLTVPGDMSMVTFDNAEYLSFLNPPMTSIAQPNSEIAQMSIKMLMRMIQKNDTLLTEKPEQILLNPTIIHRSSVENA